MHKFLSTLGFSLLLPLAAHAGDIVAKPVKGDLSRPDHDALYWKDAPVEVITLMAQPMAIPRPATTTTQQVRVQAVHDGKNVAFRLRWKDPDGSWAGRLSEFSDAVAIQFPIKDGPPPPVFMGAKDNPVHIYHWRAQYQLDAQRGKPTVRDLYPNMSVDMYPMEFSDQGSLGRIPDEDRDRFSPGRAAGNPQSYQKSGVDEIYAEGFSTSSVQEGHKSVAEGRHEQGEWTVVLVRKMDAEGGSVLTPGKKGWMGFAVWQGGQGEVGSRKCVTMMWTALDVQSQKEAFR